MSITKLDSEDADERRGAADRGERGELLGHVYACPRRSELGGAYSLRSNAGWCRNAKRMSLATDFFLRASLLRVQTSKFSPEVLLAKTV
jgi:hypothetical protein